MNGEPDPNQLDGVSEPTGVDGDSVGRDSDGPPVRIHDQSAPAELHGQTEPVHRDAPTVGGDGASGPRNGEGRGDEPEPPLATQLIENAPGLARLAAAMWWRATTWSMGASLRTAGQLARAAADPVLTAEVAAELGSQLREYARDLLGITELDERVRQLTAPDAGASSRGSRNGKVPEGVRLRAQGARLLRAAAEVDPAEHAHPAYVRILTELAPDEGRILRLLATKGPQPSIDVRAAGLIGVGAELVESGLNMVGAHAGCQYRERMPAYLNNLERLGLMELSLEPVDDAIAYQVLQAQPEVMAALKRTSRAKTVERSLRLTPFGEDFCQVCLPLDAAEVEALAGPPADPGE